MQPCRARAEGTGTNGVPGGSDPVSPAPLLGSGGVAPLGLAHAGCGDPSELRPVGQRWAVGSRSV